jgi:hypothetical protein
MTARQIHRSAPVAIALAGLLSVFAAQAALLTKADYQAGKTRIETDFKSGKAACQSLAGNAKDVCLEQAKAKEKVARADIEFGYTGTMADQRKLSVAKAESDYAVANEMCDDKAGNAKDVCKQEAKAAETKALADVNLDKKVGEARTDANADKLDADYKVAIEKCDALAGDAKTSCVAGAKARFGKT